MDITQVDKLGASWRSEGGLEARRTSLDAGRGGGFSTVLQMAGQAGLAGRKAVEEKGVMAPPEQAMDGAEERAQRALRGAEQLVSSALVQPILTKLRAANRAAAPFGPTEASKAFGSVMDAAVADSIVHSGGFAIVKRIASAMEGRGAAREALPAAGA